VRGPIGYWRVSGFGSINAIETAGVSRSLVGRGSGKLNFAVVSLPSRAAVDALILSKVGARRIADPPQWCNPSELRMFDLLRHC
jgi:hypothetical protein